MRLVLASAAALASTALAARSSMASTEAEQTELPNFITFLSRFFVGTSAGEFLHRWENVIFSLIVAGVIILLARLSSRNPGLLPGKLQNVAEFFVEQLEGFILGILGPRGRKFVPFLGTLFLYILCMNYFGLIPLMKAPTANLNQTAALAICVFIYVQYTGIRENGPLGYIDHLLGQPRSPVQYAFAPLMLVLHVIEEFVKPVSLSFRLFGNITGEDILIFIFVGLGVALTSFTHVPIGVPLQLPFYFLALLTGFIQALVFTLLSTIYFAMMLPHEEEGHH
jgi:F-type H+-transporting ATPase subunit a